jgi:Lhr-like helicase
MVDEPHLAAHAPSPLDVFDSLRRTFFLYYDTPFRLAEDALVDERRQLLDRKGGVWQEPMLELRPRYVTAGASLTHSLRTAGAGDELAQFAELGLLTGIPSLFTHQAEAFRAAAEGRDVLVTAGTGSGKTETFLLPILADLLAESRSWVGPPAPADPWWRRDNGAWAAQRAGESAQRPTAVRALILYPMNALVEDQLVRMRKALTAGPVTRWLDENRSGHRFYFGRYTGATPVLGSSKNGLAVARLRDLLQRSEEMLAAARKDPRDGMEFYVQDPLSSEMRSRWDILADIPDVLITNYSMLNVLMMRPRDQHIFAQTRSWLAEDPSRHFTLVVDELHMYRGTAGTEVSYLLRNLRDRLGLRDQPHRFRILAASASLDPGRDAGFIGDFFAKETPFTFVQGSLVDAPSKPRGSLRPHAQQFIAARCASPAEADELLAATSADEHVPSAFFDDEGRPQTVEWPTAAQRLFGEGPEAEAAFKGLMRAFAGRTPTADGPKLRAHFLFRNVPGMWACCNPGCPDVQPPQPGRSVGRLFVEPTTRCSCGSRVLDLLYCQDCGEGFLGGFTPVPPAAAADGPIAMLADVSEIEKLPDQALLERSCQNYVVYWPRPRSLPDDGQSWGTGDGPKFSWRPVRLDPQMGHLEPPSTTPATGWQFTTRLPTKVLKQGLQDRYPPYPTRCPHCEADWEVLYTKAGRVKALDPARYRSPVRGLRTGFEKINQILTSDLLERLPADQRKLVVFSDSRQDAAKLASGIGLRHHQDLIRLFLTDALRAPGASDLAQRIMAAAADPGGQDAFHLAVELIRDQATSKVGELLMLLGRGESSARDELQAAVTALSATAGRTNLDALESSVQARLLTLGMNPGGPQPSRQARHTKNAPSVHWSRLFDWSSTPPRPLAERSLGTAAERLSDEVQAGLRDEFLSSINSGAGRDVESLGIAWLTTTRDEEPVEAPPDSPAGIARASLRILTRKRRFDGLRGPADRAPAYLRAYWAKVAGTLGLSVDEVQQRCESFWGDAVKDYLVRQGGAATRTSDRVWQCERCRFRHLHPGTGICNRCWSPLPTTAAALDGSASLLASDYYAWRATRGEGEFRLVTAELTGQTDRLDAQDRQLRFQDIFLTGPEPKQTQPLELLSVTTTMEAGVDIGSLNAVLLANMPPSRFNYQQRVGRAGRRNTPVAYTLTVCRGRSHDDHYFTRPLQITNEPTPKPYITLQQQEILHRALSSEILRRAFQSLSRSEDESLDLDAMNPHGAFGWCHDWPAHRAKVHHWLGRQGDEVASAVAALTTALDPAMRPDPAQFCADLLRKVDAAAAKPYGPASLSERLAWNGLLPMYGFPTRVRYLYLNKPGRSYPWPPANTIDRESPIAVSAFAPGAELVRDGSVHPVAGVAAFEPTTGKGAPTPADNPLGEARNLLLCRRCSYLANNDDQAQPPIACPKCGADAAYFGGVDLRDPQGYFAGPKRDFDGEFSWSARSGTSRALADLATLHQESAEGLLALSGQGERFVINDRSGRLYGFRPARTGDHWPGWYNTDDLNPALGDMAAAARSGETELRVALGSAQFTDLLFVGAEADPAPGSGLRLDFRTRTQPDTGIIDPWQGRRAAWYSTAFLLRAAGAALLDVQPGEFSAGIHVSASDVGPGGTVKAFLADFLENGAGFSTWLGGPEGLPQLLARVERVLAEWGEAAHAQNCRASCYDCLRDYQNMAYHPLLDWRLARDLLTAIRGARLAVGLDYGLVQLRRWAAANGGSYSELDGIGGFVVLDKVPVIAKHPLEAFDTDEIADRLLELKLAVEDEAGRPAIAADTFTLDRQPLQVLATVKDRALGESAPEDPW